MDNYFNTMQEFNQEMTRLFGSFGLQTTLDERGRSIPIPPDTILSQAIVLIWNYNNQGENKTLGQFYELTPTIKITEKKIAMDVNWTRKYCEYVNGLSMIMNAIQQQYSGTILVVRSLY